MPKRATALTGAAGEHFVAYKLSHLGYPVALTRGGSPTVDIMVGDVSGNASVSIQVKTSNNACRVYKKHPENNKWLWEVGEKARTLKGENIIYAFVDLKGNPEENPDVYLVPSNIVAFHTADQVSRIMFGICEKDGNQIRNDWTLITNKLGEGFLNQEESPGNRFVGGPEDLTIVESGSKERVTNST